MSDILKKIYIIFFVFQVKLNKMGIIIIIMMMMIIILVLNIILF